MRISDLSSDVCSSDLLDAALASKPKVFLFNNPSNPTGMVYTGDEISALADVLVRHPDTWIITDDIYNTMLFDGLQYRNFVHYQPALREDWKSTRLNSSH